MGKGSETVSFGIGEAYGLVAQFRFENAVFFLEVGDDLLLVAIEPAGDHSDEDVEYAAAHCDISNTGIPMCYRTRPEPAFPIHTAPLGDPCPSGPDFPMLPGGQESAKGELSPQDLIHPVPTDTVWAVPGSG